MYYKLYKEKTKSEVNRPLGLDLFPKFKKIYEENDVKAIGVWENLDDPYELFFMTAFKDESTGPSKTSIPEPYYWGAFVFIGE